LRQVRAFPRTGDRIDLLPGKHLSRRTFPLSELLSGLHIRGIDDWENGGDRNVAGGQVSPLRGTDIDNGFYGNNRVKNFTEKVKKLVTSLGAGIVGIASVENLEKVTPTNKIPSNLLEDCRSVVVYGIPLLRGVMRSEDLRLKRYNAVEVCKKCDEISFNAWQSVLTKMGVFGGCFRCMEVCHVDKLI